MDSKQKETNKVKFNIKKLLKFGGNLLTVLAFVFIIKSLMSFEIDYSAYFNLKSILLILLFIAISTFIVVLGSYNWRIILGMTSGKKDLPQTEITKIYVKSNLGKYIPGNVMQFAGRNIMGTKLGITQTSIAMSSVMEILMLCVTSFTWGILLARETLFSLLSDFLKNMNIAILLVILFVLLAVGLLGLYFVFKKFRAFFFELMALLSPKSIPPMLKSFLLLSFNFLMNGVILTMIVGFSAPVTVSSFYTITVAYIISWLVGFVVPGAPGGIGIREMILTLISGDIIGADLILSAAVIQRFTLVISDVLAYGIVLAKEKMEAR